MDSRVRKEVSVWREGRTLEVPRSLVSQDCGYESHFPPRLGGMDEHLTSSSTRTNSFVLYQRCHPEGKRNSLGAKVQRLDGTTWYKRPRKLLSSSLSSHQSSPPRAGLASSSPSNLFLVNTSRGSIDMSPTKSLTVLALAAGTSMASPMLFARQRGESPCFNFDDNRWYDASFNGILSTD